MVLGLKDSAKKIDVLDVHQLDYDHISLIQIQPPSVKMSHTKNNWKIAPHPHGSWMFSYPMPNRVKPHNTFTIDKYLQIEVAFHPLLARK